MLWLRCQGPLEMKEGGGVWRWKAQERRANRDSYLAGANSQLQDSLSYIQAHLATCLHPSAFSTQSVRGVARCPLEKQGGETSPC